MSRRRYNEIESEVVLGEDGGGGRGWYCVEQDLRRTNE